MFSIRLPTHASSAKSVARKIARPASGDSIVRNAKKDISWIKKAFVQRHAKPDNSGILRKKIADFAPNIAAAAKAFIRMM